MLAEDPAIDEVENVTPSYIKKFSNSDLRKLAAPIALYPDALLAHVLPASTYPLQVVAAYRHVSSSPTPTKPLANAKWDSSIVALLNYPPILKKMNDDLDWTERLGLAVSYQMSELSDTIQQIRTEAHAAGNLVSNEKQIVIQEPDVIRVEPANPTEIYVPVYDPEVIYVVHDSWVPYISFGIGFGVGAWLDDRWDWHNHYFHRNHVWYSGGWYRTPHQWHPTHSSVPSWYRKNPNSGSGYQSGVYGQGRPSSQGQHHGQQPRPPQGQHQGQQPHVQRPQGTAEGFGHSGQEVRRDANRGQNSRQNINPQPTPRPYSPPHQNMMRPSEGQNTQREATRGGTSRGGSSYQGGGGFRGGGARGGGGRR
jgi:uncharacterized membrane protein YgcG